MPADKPTELSRIKLKNLNSTARAYDQQAFSPLDPTAVWHSHLALAIYIFLLLISMLWHRQAIFESKGDKLSSSAEGRIRTHQGLRLQIASRLNARWQTDWAIEDQAKKKILELDTQPRKNMTTMGKVGTSDSMMKIKWVTNLYPRSHSLEWDIWTHSTYSLRRRWWPSKELTTFSMRIMRGINMP